MTTADTISEDRGFKVVFSLFPRDAFAVFASGLLHARGRPKSVEVLSQEVPPPDLRHPSRFLDTALLATWEDGREPVILLVEHWSQARKVDLRRVNWYVADLALRHPRVVVDPVVLVTDPQCPHIPDRWRMVVAGHEVLRLRVRVVQVGPDQLPWLRALQGRNAVAATLRILVRQDPVEDLMEVFQAISQGHRDVRKLERLVPFMLMLAKMTPQDQLRLERRLKDRPRMPTVISVYDRLVRDATKAGMSKGRAKGRAEGKAAGKAAGKAEGRAEGRAEGELRSIRRMLARGRITVDAARAEIKGLVARRVVTATQARAVLAKLG